MYSYIHMHYVMEWIAAISASWLRSLVRSTEV